MSRARQPRRWVCRSPPLSLPTVRTAHVNPSGCRIFATRGIAETILYRMQFGIRLRPYAAGAGGAG